jgi:hypothetical protein
MRLPKWLRHHSDGPKLPKWRRHHYDGSEGVVEERKTVFIAVERTPRMHRTGGCVLRSRLRGRAPRPYLHISVHALATRVGTPILDLSTWAMAGSGLF